VAYGGYSYGGVAYGSSAGDDGTVALAPLRLSLRLPAAIPVEAVALAPLRLTLRLPAITTFAGESEVLAPLRLTMRLPAVGVAETISLAPLRLTLRLPATNPIAGGGTPLAPLRLTLRLPAVTVTEATSLAPLRLTLRLPGLVQSESRTTMSRDAAVSGRLLLLAEASVVPQPAAPTVPTGVQRRVIKRVSQTFPDPVLTDGRPS